MLGICGFAFWQFGHSDGPPAVIGSALGTAGQGCGILRLSWVGIVLLGAVLLVAVLHMLSPRVLDLPILYESSWAGIGEDVEAAGIVEALLRLATVAAVLLLCLGLANGAMLHGAEASKFCRQEPEGEKPPPGGTTPEASGAERGGVEQQLASIARAIAGVQVTAPPDDRSALNDMIAARLAPLQTSLAAIQATLKSPASAPDLKGTETAIAALARAVQSLGLDLRGKSTGGSTPPTDLAGTEHALKDIAAAIAHAPPVQVTVPACPLKVEVELVSPPAPPQHHPPHPPPKPARRCQWTAPHP